MTVQKNIILILISGLCLYSFVFTESNNQNPGSKARVPVPEGAYFGQIPPGAQPLPFGRGILSTEEYWPHSSPMFSQDGREVYFSVFYPGDLNKSKDILFMRLINGVWTSPKKASFSSGFEDDCPMFSPDGSCLYFSSNRPLPGQTRKRKYDIWMVKRGEGGWTEAQNIGKHIETDAKNLYSPVPTRSGNLYFSGNKNPFNRNHDIYVSMNSEGRFSPAVPLEKNINSNLHDSWFYVDPNERFIIFFSGAQGRGSDLCISFRKQDGTWTKRKSTGDIITSRGVRMPALSPDAKFLFFQGGEGCWWMEAQIIDYLRKHNLDFMQQLLIREQTQGIESAKALFYDLGRKHGDYFDLNESSLNRRAYQLVRYKNSDQALSLFRLNAALHPDSANVYDSLGEIHALLGNIPKAIEFYQKSLELNPDNENAKNKLKELQNK
jgi:hypothetical protein